MNLNYDIRRRRAMEFTAMAQHIIGKHVDDRRVLRDIAHEIYELCRKEGVEIITDAVRADMGLPARGPDGWTAEELLALEKRRLELMMAPRVVQIPVEGNVK